MTLQRRVVVWFGDAAVGEGARNERRPLDSSLGFLCGDQYACILPICGGWFLGFLARDALGAVEIERHDTYNRVDRCGVVNMGLV